MPKGFSAIKKAAAKSSGERTNALLLKLDDGETATVRFLEEGEEVYFYWYHDFSNMNGSQGWRTKVPCLDQDDEGVPCPGCQKRLPRKFQGLANVIWRDAPKYKKDKEGNIDWDTVDGTEDQVAIWRQGKKVFTKMLPVKDVKYKGLGSRDLEISRSGAGVEDTSYSIEPADLDSGPQPLSAKDKKLAENKYNLEEFARFVDAEKFEEIIATKVAEYNGEPDDEDEEDDDIAAFLKKKPLKESE